MTVYLVGAGPGDPELVTLRGARLLATAQVVVYDRLAQPLVELANRDAELVDVGKMPGAASVPQEYINGLLVEYGRRAECVVRLKGGDPFVFARGAEEAIALIAAGVDVAVVPGVSSALAAPAAAGVPLTIRPSVRSFTVLTGHEDPKLAPLGHWQGLVMLGGTIVILMGAARISEIAACLISAGLAPDTPLAAVHGATTAGQTVLRCRLDAVADAVVPSPATFVIGPTAGLDLRGLGDAPSILS
ncbi:MAG: uroporphyrinogen-III C-methyltransferase [Acidimicrobiales bacterium]